MNDISGETSKDQDISNSNQIIRMRVESKAAERSRLYRERHREEINRRRRENRHHKKNPHQFHAIFDMESINDIEPITITPSNKQLSAFLHAQRQQRYYEKKKDEINKRKRDRRIKKKTPATGAERNRSYRERNRQKINQRRKESRRLQQNLQQKHKEGITEATSYNQQNFNPLNGLQSSAQAESHSELSKKNCGRSLIRPVAVRNTNCGMTERNCDACVLCRARPFYLTHHFIRKHKTESYVSRLLREELNDLLIKAPFAEEVPLSGDNILESKNTAKHYKVECVFCPDGRREIADTFANLRRHFSKHTGEYEFQCKGCGIQRPYHKEIVDHQARMKCTNTGLRTLYQYPPSLMAIYIYICNICNFVQLNKKNVFKHLREQHGKIKRDENFVNECLLVALKDEPIESMQFSITPGNITPLQNCIEIGFSDEVDNEQYVVGNEPALDESFCSNDKSEIMDDEEEFSWEYTKKLSVISKGASNMNIGESFQMEVIDIKPEIDVLESDILENPADQLVADRHNQSTELEELILEKKPDPVKLTTDAVKTLLRKYSDNTGIRPDLLFQCSKSDCRGFFSNFKLWSTHMTIHHNAIITTCPHCVSKRVANAELEQPIADFEQHFKTHCLSLYLCFHCNTRCADEQQIKEHAQYAHPDITEARIEQISFNCTYAYHVLVGKDTLPVRLDFLEELCNVLRERIQHMEYEDEDFANVASSWSMPISTAWLDELSIPIFNASASNAQCVLPYCRLNFSSSANLLDHLRTQHDNTKSYMFTCKLCGISSSSKTLITPVEHKLMHSENIYVCCVCSFMTYDRRLLSKHICSEHDKRDVPVLGIKRTKSDVKVQVEIVFASEARTFTTTNCCFCGCEAKNLCIDTCVSHLKREHLLKLLYFCEYCDEPLPHLQQCDNHFHMKHAEFGTFIKVRCQLACSKDRQVNIISARPLQIRLSDEDYGSCQSHSESSKKGFVVPTPVIKNEVDDEEEYIIITEDDEVVVKKEGF